MKTNDSSHYNPLNPIWDLAYDPKGGSGILKVRIFGTIFRHDMDTTKFLPFQWSETVNGIEIDIDLPDFKSTPDFIPSAMNEDINNSLRELPEFKGKQYIINFLSK